MAWLRKGRDARSPFSARAMFAAEKALRASSEGVVTWSRGTLNLRIELSDSPNDRRSLVDLTAQRISTCSLASTSIASRPRESPVAQLTALSPTA